MFRVKGQNDPQLQRGLEVQNDIQVEHSVQSGVLHVRLMVGLYMVKTVYELFCMHVIFEKLTYTK